MMVKRWTPFTLLFSSQQQRVKKRPKMDMSNRSNRSAFDHLFWSHRYLANGNFASNEKACSAGGANLVLLLLTTSLSPTTTAVAS